MDRIKPIISQGTELTPAPHPPQGQQNCCLNSQEICRAGNICVPASPAHTPPSPLGMEIQINVVTLWANRVESSQIKIFFLGKKWHVIRTETICGSDFCWGWTFQRNKAPSQPCLQPGGVLSVHGLALSHEPHFGSEKCIFHIFPKSSPSPELWLFQSAHCRRVWLLIPLFRKRKKKKKLSRKPHLAQAQNGNKMFL